MGEFASTTVTPYVLRNWRQWFSHIQRWQVDFANASDYEHADRIRVDKWTEANAVSSEIVVGNARKGKHALLLDIDHVAYCLSSSTFGHHHLYVDVAMTWRQYKRLLRALMRAGVIERGYYRASLSRKATFLRTPETKKENG